MNLKISIDDEIYKHFLNNKYSRADIMAVHTALNNAEPDIIKCKDCKYFQRWRTPEHQVWGCRIYCDAVYECEKYVITSPSPDDYCSKAERKE